MEIVVCGAAGGEVTGSAYLVRTGKVQVLVDFGMFQGSSETELLNVMPVELEPEALNAVVLTHAHLDHTGRLPLLTKHGYRRPIYATSATVMMTDLILKDSAHLQISDAERRNRKNPKAKPVEPLYTPQDVNALAPLFHDLPYNSPIEVAPGVTIRAREAGHMLGSVSLEMTVNEGGRRKVVVFSGDIGPLGVPVLRDSVSFNYADVVFMESTYGDRDHMPFKESVEKARDVVQSAVERKGKILVPVFAIGRAQLMLYLLAGAFKRGSLPRFPVYLDSPMAIKATDVYRKHFDLFDEEAIAMHRSGELAENLQSVHTCETAQESKALNDTPGPWMVLAGSGMCTGGRILHHLRHNLPNPTTEVLITGYQSHGSLGRRLVEGVDTVRIFGEEVAVRASVHSFGGFSAHAGQTDLMSWLNPLTASRPRIILTHGEERGRSGLAEKIKMDVGLEADAPKLGAVITV